MRRTDVLDALSATNEAFLRLIDLRRTLPPDEWKHLAASVVARAEEITGTLNEYVTDDGRPARKRGKEPKCPECGVGVDRPNCFAGYPPNECPRHPLMRKYRESKKPAPRRRAKVRR